MKNENVISNQSTEVDKDEFQLRRQELWNKRIEIEKALNLEEGDELRYFDWKGWLKAKTITWLLKSIGMYRRGLLNASRIRLKQIKFIYPDIPKELHGFKILFVSDLHLSQLYPEWFISGMSVIRQIKSPVDIILLGGDYRYGYFGSEDFVVPMVKKLLEPIESRYGIYGVMGNHDVSSIKQQFEDAGINLLVNEGVEINHNDIKIYLAGVDDPHDFECSDVPSSLVNAPKDAFTIMLAHSPELIEESALWDVRLYLCGHTHGGQIGFPFIGPIYFNARCNKKFALGKWNYKGMQGYTTTGFGVTDVPVRFGVSAEMVIINLLKIDNLGFKKNYEF